MRTVRSSLLITVNSLPLNRVLLEGDASRLAEADDQSKQALNARPDDLYFRGTRGGVLTELGQVEEGQMILEGTLRGSQPAEEKALNAAYIAIAQPKIRKSKTAREAFEFVKRLDPKCPLLARENPVKTGVKPEQCDIHPAQQVG